MASILTTRNTVQLQSKVLAASFSNRSQSMPPFYERIFNIIDMPKDRMFMTFLPYAEVGTLQWKPEGAAPAYDQPFELIPYTVNAFTYALAVMATEEAVMSDPANFVGQVPGMLADAESATKDLIFNQIFNQAYNPAVLYSDGQPLASTAHPLGPVPTSTGIMNTAGTFSNSLTTTSLSPEALQQAYILFETLLTDRGLPDRRTPVDLMVPVQLVKLAQEILGTDRAPFSNDNRKNTLEGTVNLCANRYLTSNTFWAVLAGKGDVKRGGDHHHIFAAFQWQNKYKRFYDDETENDTQKTSFRGTYGVNGWRGGVYSQGS